MMKEDSKKHDRSKSHGVSCQVYTIVRFLLLFFLPFSCGFLAAGIISARGFAFHYSDAFLCFGCLYYYCEVYGCLRQAS